MAIRLIATDLDGTLIGKANEFGLYEAFRERVDSLRQQNDAFWAVCTGRSLRSFRRFVTPMSVVGISPNFAIVRHAFVFGLGRLGFAPHRFWNLRIRLLILSDRARVRRAVKDWHRAVVRRFFRVRTVAKDGSRLCLRFDSDECAEAAAVMLEKAVARYRHMKVFRYAREVDVQSVPFTKGLAVQELARHLGIRREEILAIGDGYNDMSMLDGTVAGMVGCPANAEPEIMAIVSKAGGHISRRRSLAGVLDVLDAHVANAPDSTLPDSWSNPESGRNPRAQTSSHHRRRRRRTVRLALLLGSMYAALLAFASFDLLPMSDTIMWPYLRLRDLLERLLALLYR